MMGSLLGTGPVLERAAAAVDSARLPSTLAARPKAWRSAMALILPGPRLLGSPLPLSEMRLAGQVPWRVLEGRNGFREKGFDSIHPELAMKAEPCFARSVAPLAAKLWSRELRWSPLVPDHTACRDLAEA